MPILKTPLTFSVLLVLILSICGYNSGPKNKPTPEAVTEIVHQFLANDFSGCSGASVRNFKLIKIGDYEDQKIQKHRITGWPFYVKADVKCPGSNSTSVLSGDKPAGYLEQSGSSYKASTPAIFKEISAELEKQLADLF